LLELPGPGESHKSDYRFSGLASSWVFYVANEKLPGRNKSFFAEEGLKVEGIRFDSSNTAAEAMLRGDVASDSATTMTVLLNIEERSPGTLKCFGFQVHTKTEFLESLISRVGSGTHRYTDLKGKRIGVFPGSLNQAITKLLVKDYLDPNKDLVIVQLTPSLQLQALTLGQIDALISYEPTTTLALDQRIAELVEHSPCAKHIFEPFPVASYCFTRDYLKKRPEAARRIARSWLKAIDYIRNHRQAAANTVAKYVNVEPHLAQRLNQPAQEKAGEIDKQAVQRLADLYLAFGLISRHIDTSAIYYSPER
jgi:NitT/TauT family transport system substrate-binding protein